MSNVLRKVYYVVTFPDEDTCDVVCENWFVDPKTRNEVFWPPGNSQELTKLLQTFATPGKNWTKSKVEVVGDHSFGKSSFFALI